MTRSATINVRCGRDMASRSHSSRARFDCRVLLFPLLKCVELLLCLLVREQLIGTGILNLGFGEFAHCKVHLSQIVIAVIVVWALGDQSVCERKSLLIVKLIHGLVELRP